MNESNIEELLRANTKLLEENNHILHKLHNYQKWARAMRVFYWLIVLGSLFGAYFFVQQYLTALGVKPETVRLLIENPSQLFIQGIKGGYVEQ
jgi:hypothetical protein